MVPHQRAVAGTGGVETFLVDFVEVIFVGAFQTVAGGPKAPFHAGDKFDSQVVDLIEVEFPAIHCRKAVGLNAVEEELLEGVFELLWPLVEIDHVDVVDVAHLMARGFVLGHFKVGLEGS